MILRLSWSYNPSKDSQKQRAIFIWISWISPGFQLVTGAPSSLVLEYGWLHGTSESNMEDDCGYPHESPGFWRYPGYRGLFKARVTPLQGATCCDPGLVVFRVLHQNSSRPHLARKNRDFQERFAWRFWVMVMGFYWMSWNSMVIYCNGYSLVITEWFWWDFDNGFNVGLKQLLVGFNRNRSNTHWGYWWV